MLFWFKCSLLLLLLHCGALYAQQTTWQWARSIAAKIGADGETYGSVESVTTAVATDHDGNIYLAGVFADSIVQDGFAVYSHPRILLRQQVDVFIAKYTISGELIWLRTFGSPGPDFVSCGTIDAENNFYVGGQFTGDSLIVGGTAIAQQGGGFIVKCSPKGEFEWALPQGRKVLGISARENNIYAAGKASQWETFVAKVTSGGVVEMLKIEPYSASLRIGVSAAPGGGCYITRGNSIIKYDDLGNTSVITTVVNGEFNTIACNATSICAAGIFRDSILVDSITLEQPAAFANWTMFATTHSHGGALQNLRIGVGSNSNAYGVCADSLGRFYIAGTFVDSIQFDDLKVKADHYGSSYLVRIDHDQYASLLTQTNTRHSMCFFSGIAATRDAQAVVAGLYRDTIKFGANSVATVSPEPDIAIAKLGDESSAVPTLVQHDVSVAIYPVVASTVLNIAVSTPVSSIAVFDMLGRQVLMANEVLRHSDTYTLQFNIDLLPMGNYTIQAQTIKGIQVGRFQVLR